MKGPACRTALAGQVSRPAPKSSSSSRAEPGYELALAAVLGARLRAAVAGSLEEAGALLDRSGRDGGAALVLSEDGLASASDSLAPASPSTWDTSAHAHPLVDHVTVQGAAAPLARAMLANTYGVDALSALPEPAAEPLPDEEREALLTRIDRLNRRREQLGPVNPLAQDEYADAIAHVEELESQREDLDTAIRELQGIIKGGLEPPSRTYPSGA